MKSQVLIQLLIDQTKENISQIEAMQDEEIVFLNWRKNPNSWNILECVEHLNLYGEYYLPAIKVALQSVRSQRVMYFKSGIIGGYFAKSMLPKVKLNKMKTFKDKDPINRSLDREVLKRFLNQQTELLLLLNISKEVDLNKVKVPISICKFLKLKLGDVFLFFVNHNLRHMEQVRNIIGSIKKE